MANVKIEIKKVALKDRQITIGYEEVIEDPEHGPSINELTLKGGYPVHQDLIDAMKGLNHHLMDICEQNHIALDEESQKRITANIVVTGYSIGGSDEDEGVVLIGQRGLDNGQVLNLISPFTKWESDYKGATDLYGEIAMVNQECIAYINGKHAPNPQLEMDFDEDEHDEVPVEKD
jgi:hypothetical protein